MDTGIRVAGIRNVWFILFTWEFSMKVTWYCSRWSLVSQWGSLVFNKGPIWWEVYRVISCHRDSLKASSKNRAAAPTTLRPWDQPRVLFQLFWEIANWSRQIPRPMLKSLMNSSAIQWHTIGRDFQSPANSKQEFEWVPLLGLWRPFVDLYRVVNLVFPANCFLLGSHKGVWLFLHILGSIVYCVLISLEKLVAIFWVEGSGISRISRILSEDNILSQELSQDWDILLC